MNPDMKKTLLLVEDEALLATTEKLLLEKQGYAVLIARTGAEAVESAKADSSIDLILMDINLGKGIDGTQAAEAILACRDIPIVFLSSHMEPEIVEKTEKITSYGYVVKNSSITVLDASIKMAFKLFFAHQAIVDKDESLLREKKFTEAVFESIPGMFYVYDRKGHFIRRNGNHERMTGYTTEEISKMDLLSWHGSREEVSRVQATIDEVFEKGFGTVVAPVITKSGEALTTKLTGVRLDIDGESYFVGVGIDISEMERSAKRLKESESRLARAEGVATMGNWQLDLDRREIQASAGACRVYGVSEGALSLEYVQRCVLPEYRPMLDRELSLLVGEGKPYRTEFKICRPIDGRIVDIQSIAEFDREERTVYGVVLDITGQKRIEAELQTKNEEYVAINEELQSSVEELQAMTEEIQAQNEEMQVQNEELRSTQAKYVETAIALGRHNSMLNTLLDNLPIGVFMVEAPTGKPLVANTVAAELLGRGVLPDVGKENLADVYMSFKSGTDSRYPLEEMPIVKGMNGIASRIDDMEVVRPDGTRSLLEVHGAPLADEQGRIWGSLVSFGDITEKKQKEGRINALLAEKENLLKEVHHRIKNNMAVMEALLQLKSSTLKDPSARHALKEAESHLHSMGILYDKLYQSSGSYEAVSTKEYLPALVKEVVALFPNSPKVKVETKVQDFAIDIKEMSSLGIILNEVITNSMKYAFPGNREGTIAVDAARTGKSVRIAIGDDGVGIPDGIGLDTSDGFGFHLISTLSRQLNATVTIEREKGTTFVIEF